MIFSTDALREIIEDAKRIHDGHVSNPSEPGPDADPAAEVLACLEQALANYHSNHLWDDISQ